MDTRKMFFASVVSALAFLTTACAPGQSTHQSSQPNKKLSSVSLSPAQVVKDYYRYIAEHDVQSASQLLVPKVASFYHTAPDSDFNNVKSISNVVVSKPYNAKLDDKYTYEIQVDVTYTAEYRQTITVPNGGQMRFVYLGRNSTNQPWEIISIGTGP